MGRGVGCPAGYVLWGGYDAAPMALAMPRAIIPPTFRSYSSCDKRQQGALTTPIADRLRLKRFAKGGALFTRCTQNALGPKENEPWRFDPRGVTGLLNRPGLTWPDLCNRTRGVQLENASKIETAFGKASAETLNMSGLSWMIMHNLIRCGWIMPINLVPGS